MTMFFMVRIGGAFIFLALYWTNQASADFIQASCLFFGITLAFLDIVWALNEGRAGIGCLLAALDFGIFGIAYLAVPHLGAAAVLFLLGSGASFGLRWLQWWNTPQPGFVTYEDPQVGTCMVEGISPRQARALEKEARPI